MCLAIYKPKDVIIDESALETGFENNNDGAGYTYREATGELKTLKGFFKFKDFIAHFRQHKETEAMIHFRWATSGKTNKDNCHPFRFGPKKSWSVIHNGVLHTRSTVELSDTACFTADVLHELAIRNMIHYPDVIEQIEEEIGLGNKMVLMSPDSQYLILNEERGFWQDDVWWSNDSFQKTLFRYGGVISSGSGKNWWDVDDDEYHQWESLRAHGGHTVPTSTLTNTQNVCGSSSKESSVIDLDSLNEDEQQYLDYLERKWKEGLHE